MRHLDLSFEGRQVAERYQLDNGKLPHGGYRGSRAHPPCYLSYDKGSDYHEQVDQEVTELLEQDELVKNGFSPSWSLLVHEEPSYTDESPLIARNFLAASRYEPINGVTLYNRESLLPNKCGRPLKSNGVTYYRPNRMHQYLSATELKNKASQEVNIKYGRPTRTTLLRARQRCSSAPNNAYEQRNDIVKKLDEVKSCPVTGNSEYLQLESVRDGESLHSYLTGARYNRAHCLDSKSVEHSGVYMPRHNPALGSFFKGPKGHEYLQEFEDFPTPPTPPSPQSPKRRPLTAPSQGRRPYMLPGSIPTRLGPGEIPLPDHVVKGDRSKYKHLQLNVVGCGLRMGGNLRDPSGLRLPSLHVPDTPRRLQNSVDETFRVNQPPPTPSSMKEPQTRDATGANLSEREPAVEVVVEEEENVDVDHQKDMPKREYRRAVKEDADTRKGEKAERVDDKAVERAQVAELGGLGVVGEMIVPRASKLDAGVSEHKVSLPRVSEETAVVEEEGEDVREDDAAVPGVGKVEKEQEQTETEEVGEERKDATDAQSEDVPHGKDASEEVVDTSRDLPEEDVGDDLSQKVSNDVIEEKQAETVELQDNEGQTSDVKEESGQSQEEQEEPEVEIQETEQEQEEPKAEEGEEQEQDEAGKVSEEDIVEQDKAVVADEEETKEGSGKKDSSKEVRFFITEEGGEKRAVQEIEEEEYDEDYEDDEENAQDNDDNAKDDVDKDDGNKESIKEYEIDEGKGIEEVVNDEKEEEGQIEEDVEDFEPGES